MAKDSTLEYKAFFCMSRGLAFFLIGANDEPFC